MSSEVREYRVVSKMPLPKLIDALFKGETVLFTLVRKGERHRLAGSVDTCSPESIKDGMWNIKGWLFRAQTNMIGGITYRGNVRYEGFIFTIGKQIGKLFVKV